MAHLPSLSSLAALFPPSTTTPAAAGLKPEVVAFWAMSGAIAAAFSAGILFGRGYAILAFIACVCVYWVGLRLRYSVYMRVRGAWMVNVFGNFGVSTITVLYGLFHSNSYIGLISMILAGWSIFCLIEVSRPIYDYGILQFMLRIPFQCSLVYCYMSEGGKCIGGVVLVVVSLLQLIFCTTWNCYYSSIFEQIEEMKRMQRKSQTLPITTPNEADRITRSMAGDQPHDHTPLIEGP